MALQNKIRYIFFLEETLGTAEEHMHQMLVNSGDGVTKGAGDVPERKVHIFVFIITQG